MGRESSKKETSFADQQLASPPDLHPSIEEPRCCSSAKTSFFHWEGEEIRNRIVDHGGGRLEVDDGGWAVQRGVSKVKNGEGFRFQAAFGDGQEGAGRGRRWGASA